MYVNGDQWKPTSVNVTNIKIQIYYCLTKVGYQFALSSGLWDDYKRNEFVDRSSFRRQQERRDLLAATASEHPFLSAFWSSSPKHSEMTGNHEDSASVRSGLR